jgi:hypothetical protein
MKELFVSENDWDSHRELLYVALENTRNAAVEFGRGFGSTRLMDEYCYKNGRIFISVETNGEWNKKCHVVYGWSVNDDNYLNVMQEWPDVFKDPIGLLFIDSAPGEQRKDLIKKYANRAITILAHDTEEGAEYVYGMKEILSTFKYRLDYKPEGKPWTTAVSNFIDVSKWKV